MKKFLITLDGTSPLLMHSARLSDPLDPMTKALKAVSSKRLKTDDDYEAMAETEFIGGMYHDSAVGPYIPGENIAAALIGGAKLNRLGPQVKRGLFVMSDINPLMYAGPRDIVGLYTDKRFVHRASVRVGTSRVIRTRPMFATWTTNAELLVDESQLDVGEVKSIVENTGDYIGLGDWRPRFGRFTTTIEEID